MAAKSAMGCGTMLLNSHVITSSRMTAPPGNIEAKPATAPNETADTRTRRWLWWEALAKVKVNVREYYMYTPWQPRAHATATGTPGRELVRTPHGTLTWIPNDRRIVIANVSTNLQVQLTVGFPPWDPATDMANNEPRRKYRSTSQVLYRQRASGKLFSSKGLGTRRTARSNCRTLS